MFSIEKKGLELLSSCKSIYIPKVISDNTEYILMEFIETNNSVNNIWEKFGRSIADLHQISNKYFGLEHNNYIGSLIQENDPKDKWIDFFINKRIIPQLRLGDFSTDTLKSFDKLFKSKVPFVIGVIALTPMAKILHVFLCKSFLMVLLK